MPPIIQLYQFIRYQRVGVNDFNFFFADYPKTMNGTENKFTDHFNMLERKKGALYPIRNIFDNGLAYPNDSFIKKNTEAIQKWVVDQAFDFFEEFFGFNQETDDLNIWPGTEVIKILLNKMEFIHEGLTQTVDADGKVTPKEIKSGMIRKFGDERKKKRTELGLRPKLIGKLLTLKK